MNNKDFSPILLIVPAAIVFWVVVAAAATYLVFPDNASETMEVEVYTLGGHEVVVEKLAPDFYEYHMHDGTECYRYRESLQCNFKD